MQQFNAYLRQFARFQRNARWYLVQNVPIGIALGIFLVLYPLYLSALGYGTDLIGLVLFFTAAGLGVAIIPAGLCIDRLSGKAILIWSTVVVVVAFVGMILFRNLVPLCISAFVIGLGISFQLVINAPFLTKNSTPDERTHLFSLNIVITLATTVLGEVLGGAFPSWLREHPRAMFSDLSWLLASQPLPRSYQITLLGSFFIVTTSLIPLFLMTNDRPTSVRSERQPVLLSLRQIWLSFWNNFKRGRVPLRQRDVVDVAFWQRLRIFLLSPLTIMTGAHVLLGLGGGMLFPYIGLFFVEHLGANSALFGIVDGSARAVTAAATLLAPLIAMSIGRLKTIVLFGLLSIPVIIFISVSPILLIAAVLYPLYRVLWNMSDGIVQVFGMEIVPPERRGLANSSYQVALQVAMAIAAPIGGFLISRLGYTRVFWITAVLFLLFLLLIWWRFGGKYFVTPEAKPQEAMAENQQAHEI